MALFNKFKIIKKMYLWIFCIRNVFGFGFLHSVGSDGKCMRLMAVLVFLPHRGRIGKSNKLVWVLPAKIHCTNQLGQNAFINLSTLIGLRRYHANNYKNQEGGGQQHSTLILLLFTTIIFKYIIDKNENLNVHKLQV